MNLFEDDRVICSPSVSPLFLPRSIGNHRWSSVEAQMPNARPGVRVLVGRHEEIRNGRPTITEYITTRLSYPNRYDGWSRVTVVYAPGEPSPYHYQYDSTRVQRNALPMVALPSSSSELILSAIENDILLA